MSNQAPQLRIAIEAARKAGLLLMRYFEQYQGFKIKEKTPENFLSTVRSLSEQTIVSEISSYFPDDQIISQATEVKEIKTQFSWLIEPLGGATNYFRVIPHFSVSIACLSSGDVRHAVVYDPFKDDEFTASKGRGTQLNNQRLRVSRQAGLHRALIATNIESESPFTDAIKALGEQACNIRCLGTTALDLAYLAVGRYDGVLEWRLKPWNSAAGILLVQESGGLLSNFNSSDKLLESETLIAAPSKVFRELLSIARKYRPDPQ